MSNPIILRLIVASVILCLSGQIIAQPPGGPFVVSPQVLTDKKVRFSYLAPLAKEVRLAGSHIWMNGSNTSLPACRKYSNQIDGTKKSGFKAGRAGFAIDH